MNQQIELAQELGQEIDHLFWNVPEDFTEFTNQICELTHRINSFGLASLPYNYDLWKHIEKIRQEVWETYYMLRKAKFYF